MTARGDADVEGTPAPRVIRAAPRHAPRVRVFGFAHCGGGARLFRAWPASLPDELEVCPVLLPGREERLHEPPFTSLAAAADASAIALRPWLDLPFVLFGHSLGALLAFEVARRLRDTGVLPAALVVSACAAPPARSAVRKIHHLPDDQLLDAVAELGGLPGELREDPASRREIMPSLRADFTMVETYAYETGTVLPTPIVAMGGLADRAVDRRSIERWREQTTGRFSLSLLPGDHFYLTMSPRVFFAALSREIAAVASPWQRQA